MPRSGNRVRITCLQGPEGTPALFRVRRGTTAGFPQRVVQTINELTVYSQVSESSLMLPSVFASCCLGVLRCIYLCCVSFECSTLRAGVCLECARLLRYDGSFVLNFAQTAAPRGFWDLSSPTRDLPWVFGSESTKS